MVSMNMIKFKTKLDETSDIQRTKEEIQKELRCKKIIFDATSLDDCNVSTDELLEILAHADDLINKVLISYGRFENIKDSLKDSKAMIAHRLI